MARYRFVTEWQIDAPVARVWDAVLDHRQWPTWWRGFRSAEQLSSGDERGIGMRIRQGWRSRLPCTLVIDVEIVAVERHRLLDGRSSGDMEGACTWTFEERDGRTSVRFVMDVRPTRWWMNLPVPFAGEVVAWNYGTVMRWGGEGLARILGAGVVDRTAQPEAAGA